jgi:hypothetical protein
MTTKLMADNDYTTSTEKSLLTHWCKTLDFRDPRALWNCRTIKDTNKREMNDKNPTFTPYHVIQSLI